MSPQRTPRDWLQLLALSFLWGSSFLFVKIAVRTVPPATLVAARFAVAAIVLTVIVRAMGLRLPRSARIWSHYLLIGVVGNSLPFTLIAWGQIRVDVGLAGILLGSVPLMTMSMAHFFVPGERMTPRIVCGLVAGFVGLAILLGPEALLELGGQASDLPRQAAILGAALCYATSSILARRLATLDSLVSATTVMWTTCAIMIPAALWFDGPWDQTLSGEAIFSIAWLGLLATALATLIFFQIVRRSGPTFLSLMNYLIPVVALVAGAVVLGEEPTGGILVGLLLILAGLAVSQLGGKSR